MNQIDIPDYQYHLDCNAKKNGPRNFPRKKFVFHTEMSTYSLIIRLFYFQKYRMLSGQEVVQIKPNSVWRIPCVIKA